MRLSYSALETFKQCPLKFKFQYLDKIKTPKSKEALFGTLVHKTLKVLHEPGLLPPTEDEILKFFSNNWDSTIYPDEREAAFAFSQGVQILKNYYAKNYPARFNVLALETSFEVPLESGGEAHIITGKIDRIDKVDDAIFEIIDYKTAKKMPAQESIDNDLQLAVYHLGLANRWPHLASEGKPVKVSLYFLKHSEKLSTFKNARHLEQTKENIAKTIAGITLCQKDAKFSPRAGALCDWCEYQRNCPLFRHKFVKEKIFFNEQEIGALINEYLVLQLDMGQKEKRAAEIKGELAKFMDQEGMERLFGDDGYITRKIIQRFKYDAELLRQILEPLGKWQEILKIDDAKLKKLAKELPIAARANIDSARKIDKEYKSFSVSKTKPKTDKLIN